MKNTCNEVNEYMQWAADHPDSINEERKLLFKNIVVPTLNRDDVFFDSVAYYNCIKYSEKWYYPLFPYQKFIYAFFFMYVDDHPLFRVMIIEMGRGNGKDGLMMPILNFLQTPLYGVKNYHIDIVANAEDPARNSFDVVHSMLTSNSETFKGKFYWNKEEITNLSTHSKLRFNTSNAKTKYGKQTGLVLFNEYHTYEDYSQIKTFTSGLGKIKHPRTVIITTNGYVRGGPLDDILNICIGVLNGENNKLGYFPFLCKLDSDPEIDMPERWVKSNPSIDYMPILKQTIMDDYETMKMSPSLRAEFITMRMNLPRRDESLTVASWEKILRSSYTIHTNDKGIETSRIERKLPNLEDELCIVGIDYADIRDFATAGFLFKVDGEIIWKSKTWICRRSPFFNDIKFPFDCIGQPGFTDFEIVDTPSIDANEMIRWVVENMSHYRVMKIIMDSYRFKMIRSIFESYGIVGETKDTPYGLVRMIRNPNSVMSIVAPSIEFYFSEEKINAGDSALWRWAVNNTGVRMDGNGNKVFFKIEPLLRKNDPFMAFEVAMSEEQMLNVTTIYV